MSTADSFTGFAYLRQCIGADLQNLNCCHTGGFQDFARAIIGCFAKFVSGVIHRCCQLQMQVAHCAHRIFLFIQRRTRTIAMLVQKKNWTIACQPPMCVPKSRSSITSPRSCKIGSHLLSSSSHNRERYKSNAHGDNAVQTDMLLCHKCRRK